MSDKTYTREEAQELERKIGRPLKWTDVSTPNTHAFILAQHQPPLSREHGMFARDKVKQTEEEIGSAIMSALKALHAATGLKVGNVDVVLLDTGPMFENPDGELMGCTVRLSFGA